MFAPTTPYRIRRKPANAVRAIGVVKEIVVDIIYPMDVA
jgi:hypothetical protein